MEKPNNFVSCENKLLKCIYCSSSHRAIKTLFLHMKRQHEKHMMICSTCRRTFFTRQHLEAHIAKHNTKTANAIRCGLCPRAFFKTAALIAHQPSHGGIMTLESGFFFARVHCEVCRLCKASCVSLREHNLTCPLRPHPKSLDNRVLQKEAANRVLMLHSCTICDRVFTDENNFNRHQLYHKKKRLAANYKYNCKYCSRGFQMPSAMFKHFRRTHTDKCPFFCTICQEAFSLQHKFSTHILKVHQNIGTVKFDESLSIVYVENQETNRIKKRNASQAVEGSPHDSSCSSQSDIMIINDDLQETTTTSKMNKSSLLDHDADMVEMDGHDMDELETLPSKHNNPPINTDASASNINQQDKCSIQEVDNNIDLVKDSEHSYVMKPGHNVVCKICHMQMAAVLLQRHMKIHTTRKKGRLLPCYLCSYGLRTETKLHEHIKEHFVHDKLLCKCGLKFTTELELSKHKQICKKPLNIAIDIVWSAIEQDDSSNANLSQVDPLDLDNTVNITDHQIKIQNNSLTDSSNSNSTTENPFNVIPKNIIIKRHVISPNIVQPPTLVRIKRITREEASSNTNFVIKTTPVCTPYKPNDTSPTCYPATTATIPEAAAESDETMLVNVNPFEHLIGHQLPQPAKKKYYKPKAIDYLSVIQESLKDSFEKHHGKKRSSK